MESVKNLGDIANLENNNVYGNFELTNTEVRFIGNNNILFCEDNVKLFNSNIFFRGNNSIVYLSYTKYGNYNLNVNIRNDSSIYMGKDNAMGSNLNITVEEHQNIIVGDDCLIENNIDIRTSESFPIYDLSSKKRLNYSQSIFIGDHVWIDHFVHISRGSRIGSGSIVGADSFVAPMSIIHSNTHVLGNPANVIGKNVFFTKEFTGSFNSQDTLNFSSYKSDVFKYNFVNGETLDINKIDEILNNLLVNDRLEFFKKLFVRNKRRNRFFI